MKKRERDGLCTNQNCDNHLSSADIANGLAYCSDECLAIDLTENAQSRLWDDPDEE